MFIENKIKRLPMIFDIENTIHPQKKEYETMAHASESMLHQGCTASATCLFKQLV